MSRRLSTIAAVISLAATLASGQSATAPLPVGSLVDVGGYRVHLYCTGEGSPTVVVVGGAFSFDWGLIQPEVAKFTRICTYDPAGSTWSDPYRFGGVQQPFPPNCTDRVAELHRVLYSAGIPRPYVLVGFSIGGLTGRLYARDYSDDVAGMVIIDHAFIDVGADAPVRPPVESKSAKLAPGKSPADVVDSPPVLISSEPITLGLEDDQNFSKLPQLNRDLHIWAMSIHSWRPDAQTAAECSAAVARATEGESNPLGDRPLIVIRTSNNVPGYSQLQAKLLHLSRNSREVLAENSSHMVIIDQPEIVTAAIRQVVEATKRGMQLH